MTAALSQLVASGLLARLTAGGVTEYLVAPGSRSQALAIAAAQLERAGLARVTVRLDERSLGFTALGLATATQRVVAVITTSGSAVANLHPAVLEAHHAGRPLLLLTADRPHELRGVGANQTTNQVGIFADAVRHCFDIPAAASEAEVEQIVGSADRALAIATGRTGERPGPVQLNLGFREPLSGSEPDAAARFNEIQRLLRGELAQVATLRVAAAERHEVAGANLGCVIAGGNAGPSAAAFAAAAGWPLFAEPHSGAREGRNLIPRYADVLRSALAADSNEPVGGLLNQIRQVVIFGRPTLNRVIAELLARDDIEITVVRDALQGTYNPTGRAERFVDSVSAASAAKPQWLADWHAASASATSTTFDTARRELVTEVFATSQSDGSALLLGASDLIRQADRWATGCEGMQIFANRGVSGIDGTIATAQGLALSGKYPGVRLLLGDLTFLHDLSSLNQTGLSELNLQLVVGNDDGGRIFQKLRISDMMPEPAFAKLFLTPQTLGIEAIAGAFGWAYSAPVGAAELRIELAKPGPRIIEYRLPT